MLGGAAVGDERREIDRQDDGTTCGLFIEIQDGFMFHRILPKLVDYSETGAQFSTYSDKHVKIDRTIIIHTCAGTPPRKHIIEAEIVWAYDGGGKVNFGCKFFHVQTMDPLFA